MRIWSAGRIIQAVSNVNRDQIVTINLKNDANYAEWCRAAPKGDFLTKLMQGCILLRLRQMRK